MAVATELQTKDKAKCLCLGGLQPDYSHKDPYMLRERQIQLS